MYKALQNRSAVLLLCGCAAALPAQMHKVERPDRVTRAIGVYEWTGDLAKPTAARLVPVSLFIDGHFEDAGVYLARPVPFTLQTGDVYSVERAGQGLGMLDLDYARNLVTRRAAADDDPVGVWYGYGTFRSPAPPPKSTLRASTTKPRVDGVSASDDDDQPHFVVRSGAEDTGADSSKPSGKSPAAASAPANPAPDDDPDRPTLRHRDAPPPKSKKEKDGGSVIPMSASLNDDPDRPTLRRGQPQEDYIPKQLTGTPGDLHQVVAVSDAANRDPHIFTREWESPTEQHETLSAIEALARPMVVAYLTENKLKAAPATASTSGPSFATTPSTPPAPVMKKTSARTLSKTSPATPAPPVFALSDEVLEGYLLSYGGLPTFVYTTDIALVDGGPVYLTLVAQRLPSGELQVALSSITDAGHLDRVPWMRPVDVVDADASNRASLLMELRAQTSRQFALYRLVTAKAEQTFVTGILE